MKRRTIKKYYNTLGVPRNASAQQIKRAYREKAKQHHPDQQGGNEAQIRRINEAYEILSTPKERARYDRSLDIFLRGGRFGEPKASGAQKRRAPKRAAQKPKKKKKWFRNFF